MPGEAFWDVGGGVVPLDTLEGADAAGAGEVPTADGLGGVAWATPTGGGSGVTLSRLGKTAVGGTWETLTTHRYYMKKITLAGAGVLTSVEAYIQLSNEAQVRQLGFALWADNAGSPRELLAYSDNRTTSILLDAVNGAGGINARWYSGAFGRYLGAGSYWIGCGSIDTASGGHFQLAYDGSGSDRYYTSGSAWISDSGFYAVTTGTRDYSICATVIA